MRQTPSSVPFITPTVGISLHLALGIAAAAGVARWLTQRDTPRETVLMLALGAGLFVLLPLIRSVYGLEQLLTRPNEPVSGRWHGAFTPIVERVRTLTTNAHEVALLREKLIEQTRDTAAQQERNRLARELHDSIKQQVFSMQMSAAAAEARFEHDTAGALTALRDVRQSAHEAMVEMNALLQQLAPAPLEKVGLAQAIRDQCEALRFRAGVEVTLQLLDFPPDELLPMGAQTNIFRMVQEALSNIARHARAQQVHVRLGQASGGAPVELTIADDGQGFAPDASTTTSGGMGLMSIRERAMSLGGSLSITSTPEQGTSLHIVIPLVEPEPDDIMKIEANHTLNRIALVGLAGGALLTALLWYPLYVVLPATLVADWQSGSTALAWALQLVALLVPFGAGYLAARTAQFDSRLGGAFAGILAGGGAAIIAYALLIAPASTVISNPHLLQRELAPASGNTEFMFLITESVINTIWGTQLAFMAVLAFGISAGAVGGLAAPVATISIRWRELRMALATTLHILTVLTLFTLLAFLLIMPPMFGAMARALTEAGAITPLMPVEGIVLPILTIWGIYLAVYAALHAVMRRELREDMPTLWTRTPSTNIFDAILGVVPVFGALALLTNTPDTSVWVHALNLVGVSVALGFAASFIRNAVQLRQRNLAAGVVAPLNTWNKLAYGSAALAIVVCILSPVLSSWLGIQHTALLAIFVVCMGVIQGSVWHNKKLQRTESYPAPTFAQTTRIALQAHLNALLLTLLVIPLGIAVFAPILSIVLLVVVAIVPLAAFGDMAGAVTTTTTIHQVLNGLYQGYPLLMQSLVIGAVIVLAITGLGAYGALWVSGRRAQA